MFSFKKGLPIALIRGGEQNKKIICLYDETRKKMCCDECTGKGCGCCKKCGKMKGAGCAECQKKVKIDKNDILYPLRKDLGGLLNKQMTEVKIEDGEIQQIPRMDMRECLYIAGPSGSGKSTYASKYIKYFQKLYPKRKFVLFSNVKQDDVLDKLDPIRILLDEKLVENPINPEELKNCIVLFDDIDYINNKDVKESVKHLRDLLLETGRHEDIYVITTAHNLTAGRATSLSLLESSSITFFPHGGDDYHIRRVLRTYCGLSNQQASQIINMESRWVTMYKKFPMYILSQKHAFFVKNM